MDINLSQVETPENLLENQTQSGNPCSISMVALPDDSFTPECRLRTIGELDTPDESKPLIGNGVTTCEIPPEPAVGVNLTEASAQQNTGSMGRSQISTLQSVVSEPLNNPSQSRRPYTPAGTQPNSNEYGSMQFKSLGSSSEIGPRQVHPDQLVEFFKDMPRRRYAPEAIIKQRRLGLIVRCFPFTYQNMSLFFSCPTQVKYQTRLTASTRQHSDVFDSDDEEIELTSESALAALQSAAEAGRAWAAEAEATEHAIKEVEETQENSFLSWSRLFTTTPKPSSTPNHRLTAPRDNTANVARRSVADDYQNSTEKYDDEDSTTAISGWRLMTLSAAFLTGASLVGLTVLLETEIHSPLTAAIRSHPWLLEFDARYYRPFRSALFSWWRR
ncbi:hypothetical protein D915_003543 [Fasciola hepatica]|uniref:Uncharacterized protein n=1 Tax=Fasciola hepatica TaxID=6192 RepID=A0A4E0RHL2_FASHE|nr:hypothetical protein D915_003543 [Fasciola hepatica]